MHVCSVALAPQINWITSAELSSVFTCSGCQVDNGVGFLLFTLLTLCLWFSRVHMHKGGMRAGVKEGELTEEWGLEQEHVFFLFHEKNQ